MTEAPWRVRRWVVDRLAELLWTSLGIPALGFWVTLFALIYVAIWTTRPIVDLGVLALGLMTIHAGRKVWMYSIETKANGQAAKPPSQGTQEQI